MEGIISAVITGSLALIGIIISNISSNKKIENQLDKAQAITECKLEALTREVREHNNFAQRIPVMEEQIRTISEKVATLENK